MKWMILGIMLILLLVFGVAWLVMAGMEDDAAERRLWREIERHKGE